jgi:PRTRC genetic system protein E
MFTELMPILKSRPVTITITSVDKTKIRVNVIPKAVDSDSQLIRDVTQKDGVTKEDVAALITPLSLVGTPEEIDAELSQLLASYSDGHTTVLESLKELQETLAEVAKSAKEATAKAKTKTPPAKADKKTDEGKSVVHPTKTTPGTAQAPDSFTLWEAAGDANAAAAVHAEEPAAAPPAEDGEVPAELPDGFDEGEAE